MRIRGAACNLLLLYSEGDSYYQKKVGNVTYYENIIGNKPTISGNHAFSIKEPTRSRKLAGLMTEMEEEYNIPMIRTEDWEIRNRPILFCIGK